VKNLLTREEGKKGGGKTMDKETAREGKRARIGASRGWIVPSRNIAE